MYKIDVKLLIFNSANVVVNPDPLAPICKSDIGKAYLHTEVVK